MLAGSAPSAAAEHRAVHRLLDARDRALATARDRHDDKG